MQVYRTIVTFHLLGPRSLNESLGIYIVVCVDIPLIAQACFTFLQYITSNNADLMNSFE
jgi:hypothetical protein